MRRRVKAAIARVVCGTRADRMLSALTGARNMPLILGYHRVVKDFAGMSRTSIPAMLITDRMLEHHIDWLAARYRLASLDEIGARLESGEAGGEPLAALTFDDGYADAYENAFPIIRRKGIPAAIFVATDLMDGRRLQTWDRLYLLMARAADREGGAAAGPAGLVRLLGPAAARIPSPLPPGPVEATRALLASLPQDHLLPLIETLERRFPPRASDIEALRPLDWDMITEMQRAGVTIGSHTRTHPLLTRETPERVIEEVAGSRRVLQQRLGTRVDHIAYPDGRFDRQVVAVAKAAGYRFGYGVCTHRDPADPLLTIPRKLFWENSCIDSKGRFSAAIMGCHASPVLTPLGRCRRHDRSASIPSAGEAA